MISRSAILTVISGAVLLGAGIGVASFAFIQPNNQSQVEVENTNLNNNSVDAQLIDDHTKAIDTSAQAIAQPEWKVLTESPDNRIVIPKINVATPITEGDHADDPLHRGSWRLPMTSTPDQGGNTVFSAHRFLRLPPDANTFYDLDKLEIGDTFTVYWEGQEYLYQVTEVLVINPDQVEILYNTNKPRVTLFTCTPLFTNLQRLVVIGEPIS